jgi:hypothetical protein
MVRVFGLQSANQKFELGKVAQTGEARIFQEKGPTGEPGADAPLKPFKGSFAPSRQGQGASDLMISVVCVPERSWNRTRSSYIFDCRFCVPGQSVE